VASLLLCLLCLCQLLAHFLAKALLAKPRLTVRALFLIRHAAFPLNNQSLTPRQGKHTGKQSARPVCVASHGEQWRRSDGCEESQPAPVQYICIASVLDRKEDT